MTLDKLNTLTPNEAEAAFSKCCGSSKWVAQMISSRPFSNKEKLLETATKIWNSLAHSDWLEAFSHHPRIGKIEDLEAKFSTTQAWATEEQKGVQGAPQNIIQNLARENLNYENLFGHVFLVCATGKTAEEMLSLLRIRIKNPPSAELNIAAQEQNKITHIRLEKLLSNENI
ncbi:MAG: 2-oxo-4-hydroxy-4-carboxy-5-ureidoimidazoline decarboxylase [Bdellovibrionia bacterium]